MLYVYGGVLPSPKMRWCTKQMKIIPLEKWVGDDEDDTLPCLVCHL